MLFKSIVSLALVAAAAAQTAIKGKVFDHIFIVFLENTDYTLAASDPALQAFISQGVLLDKYYGVTHPSEPNYIAAAGGDYFGMNDDAFYAIPSNYTTIVDLLEKKNLTWKAYQEDAPTACYRDFQNNGLYFRKHNPFIIYDSIATNATRCANVVPATQLQTDIAAGNIPNYAFYTPNMINDGHNTTVADASKWLTSFLPPLLSNKSFINNTLVVITFDETETYKIENRVWTMLLGDVVANFKNTTDSTFYTHYSLLSTVESNWDLGNLGRQDANATVANVFDVVAKSTGYTNQNITNPPLMNGTEPGFLAPTPTASPTSTSTSTSKPSSADALAAPKVMAALAALTGAFAALI
ncbi:phosphoesterase family-domain-containing protein [Gamsiella multidivaricata]|uniref:phosphoesterase family-domain-containing protein n=1 Tax=Gamsiella multidivaricata TaxID=101098 RepID=UPI00221F9444|nr:phosphoesterase family-domain-containing protein [Gamsiella multidivaricata]KAG0370293.1 hypothetical protein BGZ54_006979 [Gamsiella multidivaricata]KAI7832413.1 phosphoesterase family-domain-containing protein [Gamsiella multidivaricata]